MRIFSLCLIGCLVAFSLVIYEVKYETREMNDRVAALHLEIKKERDAIGVLRAEWGHLNRPKRVERLARKHLGLRPVQAPQVITASQLADLRGKSPGPDSAPSRPLAENAIPRLHHPVKAVR